MTAFYDCIIIILRKLCCKMVEKIRFIGDFLNGVFDFEDYAKEIEATWVSGALWSVINK